MDYYVYIKKAVVGVCISLLSVGIIMLARMSETWTELFYSNGIYNYIRRAISYISGLFPFSLAEIVLLVLVVGIVAYFTVKITKAIKGDKFKTVVGVADATLSILTDIFVAVSVVILAFCILCAPNYYRESFADSAGYNVTDTTSAELSRMTTALALQLNSLAEQVEFDEEGELLVGMKMGEVSEMALVGFNSLGEEYSMAESYVEPKSMMFSTVMSYFRLAGFYFPYTTEPNINTAMPMQEIPSTMMHELTHTVGHMREDEANFVAFLACRESEMPEFKYSGYLLAFNHSISALYSADTELFNEVYALLSPTVRKSMTNSSEYWKQFETPLAEVSEAINDTYLKVNNQTDGTRSYGRVVDLLIAEHRDNQMNGKKF